VKSFLLDWRNLVPVAGLAVLAITGIILWFRRKPEDANEIERQRRAYLNRIGRIVEGQILEIMDHAHSVMGSNGAGKTNRNRSGMFARKRHVAAAAHGSQKLLYYTYAISGVTYETAQDVTGMEERAHLNRVAAGQTASVKYDPSNPSNSILMADDWSGLH
jgi:hypothetical protein